MAAKLGTFAQINPGLAQTSKPSEKETPGEMNPRIGDESFGEKKTFRTVRIILLQKKRTSKPK